MSRFRSRPVEFARNGADSASGQSDTLHHSIAALDVDRSSSRSSTSVGLLGLLILLVLAGAMLAHQHESFHLIVIIVAAIITIFIALVLDLRAHRRFQARLSALAQATASRERQLALILHDIRDPLATLSGMINLLSDKNLDEQLRSNLLTRIAASATSADMRIKNALDLYLFDAQHLSASRRPVDINPIIQEVIERYLPEARLKQISVDYRSEPLPAIEIDPLHFDRIVSNLISNAIELSPAGSISIKLLHDRRWLTLQIANDEAAVSPSELEHFFDRPDSTATNHENAALARYLTRSLVELDGGLIRATTENGRGLVVAVQMPISSDGEPLLSRKNASREE